MTRSRVALVALAAVAALAVAAALAVRPSPGNAWTGRVGVFDDGPAGWLALHDGFVERSRAGGVEVVFLGDSYTEGWPADAWSRHFAPLGAVNYGIRGDGTAQVLWRVEHGELDAVRPRAVVLMVGLNNAVLAGDSPGDAARGVATLLAAIRAKLPAAKVLLLGVLPVLDPGNSLRVWVTEFNARVAPLADGDAVRFLDLGPRFLNPDGSRKPGLYVADRVHLADPGYDLLAAAIVPALAEMPR